MFLFQGRVMHHPDHQRVAVAFLRVRAGFVRVAGAGACAAVLAPEMTAWMVALETSNWTAITASDKPVACSDTALMIISLPSNKCLAGQAVRA